MIVYFFHSSDRLCEDIDVQWIEQNYTIKILGITFSTNLESVVMIHYNCYFNIKQSYNLMVQTEPYDFWTSEITPHV